MCLDALELAFDACKDIARGQAGDAIVGEADTGEEALMLVANLTPDVVITDINLPDMTGIEATTRFKQLRTQMVVLGLSVDTDESTQGLMMAAGAETLLSKECAADELTAAIVKHHSKRSCGNLCT